MEWRLVHFINCGMIKLSMTSKSILLFAQHIAVTVRGTDSQVI